MDKKPETDQTTGGKDACERMSVKAKGMQVRKSAERIKHLRHATSGENTDVGGRGLQGSQGRKHR